ncbi:MAG: HNH endonuclease, partial [Candidatus Eisenbacteria bacterium]
MNKFWLAGLQPHEVWRGLSTRSAEMRAKTAELLCYIAEADARQLYRDQACDSMYACCVRVLLMSEDAACRRIDAARVARSHPRIFPALEDGRLNVSAILLLKPHLTTSNADELISAAEGKSKRVLAEWLAARFPKADLPTVLRRIDGAGPASTASDTSTGQLGTLGASPSTASEASLGAAGSPPHPRSLVPEASAAASGMPIAPPVGNSPASCSGLAPTGDNNSQSLSAPARIDLTTATRTETLASPLAPSTEPRPRITPLSAERYGLQVTISKNAHDLLRRAQDLLAHAMPPSEVGAVLERALTELVEKLEHAKFAQTDRPAGRRSSGETRHIPAEIKRQVHARDGGRCTFESDDGRRCGSQRRLEYDHIQPLAKGGRTTVDNVRLLCAKHNQLEAERRLGAGFMAERRAGGRRRSVGTA